MVVDDILLVQRYNSEKSVVGWYPSGTRALLLFGIYIIDTDRMARYNATLVNQRPFPEEEESL